MQVIQTIVILVIINIEVNGIKFYKSERPVPVFQVSPCFGSEDIVSVFKSGLVDGYNITIKRNLNVATEIRLTFDSGAGIQLGAGARYSSSEDSVYNVFNILLIQSSDNFTFTVKGHPPPHSPPYVTSIKIDGSENCQRPNVTYFEDLPVGITKRTNVPDRFCGKRKILHTGLIVSGATTKPGDWPWHVALFRRESSSLKYICGGTIISKHLVLTAAHCTTIDGVPVVPDILNIFIGKYHLFGKDDTAQEAQVFQVIVHDDFRHKTLKNDISLLKLKTEIIFNNYVQPACLWYENVVNKLPTFEIFGTVVGWGFDKTDALTSTIHALSMPLVPNVDCIYSNPIFYSHALQDGKKFCAGYNNGSSPCNGDSGGGFHVFVPDAFETGDKVPGAWYVRGIVSASISRRDAPICEATSYAVFTDISKYLGWIKIHIT